jgi:flagellar basal-body rod protein FlgF
MDALIYTAMSGAERAMRAQQVHANNLANLETPGFRADLELATAQAVEGYGYDARYLSELHAASVSSRQGALRQTGRDLDVAVVGEGYFTVRDNAGGEAYTRAGNFSLDAEGGLLLNGRQVLGDGGEIVLPPHVRLAIGQDGTVSVQPPGQTDLQAVDRLKLVRPPAADLAKNANGLLVARSGEDLPTDETVRVSAGYLEGSNVSAVEEMVATLAVTRDFEVQMKLLGAAESMADAGNRLVRG